MIGLMAIAPAGCTSPRGYPGVATLRIRDSTMPCAGETIPMLKATTETLYYEHSAANPVTLTVKHGEWFDGYEET